MKLFNHTKSLSAVLRMAILALTVVVFLTGCSETTEQKTKEPPKMEAAKCGVREQCPVRTEALEYFFRYPWLA